MLMKQATAVRREWSETCDGVIHNKPIFIKRTRDRMWLSNLTVMEALLSVYHFTAERVAEDDGSVTLSLNEMDLIENGKTEVDAVNTMGNAILDYAYEYYNEFELYSRSPNRKAHIPYVFKALIIDDPVKIGEIIQCRDGKN